MEDREIDDVTQKEEEESLIMKVLTEAAGELIGEAFTILHYATDYITEGSNPYDIHEAFINEYRKEGKEAFGAMMSNMLVSAEKDMTAELSKVKFLTFKFSDGQLADIKFVIPSDAKYYEEYNNEEAHSELDTLQEVTNSTLEDYASMMKTVAENIKTMESNVAKYLKTYSKSKDEAEIEVSSIVAKLMKNNIVAYPKFIAALRTANNWFHKEANKMLDHYIKVNS